MDMDGWIEIVIAHRGFEACLSIWTGYHQDPVLRVSADSLMRFSNAIRMPLYW